MGKVGHWGHVHSRQNRYDAIVTIKPVAGAWKVVDLELLEEKRLFDPEDAFRELAHIKSEEEYDGLYRRSIEDPEGFWGEVAKDLKWECTWYTLKFDLFYCYYQWGQIDSAQLATCKNLVTNFRQATDDPGMNTVGEKCGNNLLQKRYLWLWDKVR